MTTSGTPSFGLDTFGDLTVDDAGNPEPAGQVIRNLVEQAVLADSLGVDHFNVGEHHRDDFAVSAPDTVLAGIATRTERITLGSAVTVLSSDDPVRVFERFATLDALSQGRAEITAGRGSFTESFPLFGYSLADYDVLFVEKLELLVALLEEGAVTWSGSTRTPLADQQVYPKTERGRIPMRVGVGGTPESVVRAARLNLPMALAVIGGDPARFTPIANLYRHALSEFGQGPAATVDPLARATSPTPTSRRRRSCGRTTGPCSVASVASAAGRPPRTSASSTRSSTARCMWAPPRRSLPRSCTRCVPWAPSASTSSTPTERWRTAGSCTRSSSTPPR